MRNKEIDVLIVGAGTAGLATAIRLKDRLRETGRSGSVVVIDKAPKPGYHALSGAVFEDHCLDALVPGWRSDEAPFVKHLSEQRVIRDNIYFLMKHFAVPLPGVVLPKALKHKGDALISASKLIDWLVRRAAAMGVELYSGFSAHRILIENRRVKGVVLGEKGVNRHGHRQSNYMPEEILRAKVTVFADGCLGTLSTKLIREFRLDDGKNPQVYSLGVKQILKLPEANRFGSNRALHTIGYPNRYDVMGGGLLYDMGKNTVAVGLAMGLDWRYCDLDPEQELELFKSHPFIARLIEGGEVVAAGVKTIPEGGYFSVPKLHADGALIVGDAAGLLNMKKLKGLHLSIQSGMAAGDTVAEALAKNDTSDAALRAYDDRLRAMGAMTELRTARNFRQGFTTPLGLFAGGPLMYIQHLLPVRLKLKPDHVHATLKHIRRAYGARLDHKTFVGLSGALHDEELKPHITILSVDTCRACMEKYKNPCVKFCPGEIYTLDEIGRSITVSAADCMHCKTCMVKCPEQNIVWEAPEGGQGPRYRAM